jgi:hypothetical protein
MGNESTLFLALASGVLLHVPRWLLAIVFLAIVMAPHGEHQGKKGRH